jgi:hypothetical protein
MITEKVYKKPMVLSHQPIRFETAQCTNPGRGNLNHPGIGLGQPNFPGNSNPNPTPGGAGAPGQGNGQGNGKADPNGNGSQTGIIFGG